MDTAEVSPETTGDTFSVPHEVAPVPSQEGQTRLVAPPLPISSPAGVPQQMDPILRTVENVLSEDLAETYKQLAPDTQQEFKKKGEQVARTVKQMITTGTFHAKKVLSLVLDWLRLIPHINRFFLEQEAKRKIDVLTHLAEKEKKNRV